MEKLKSVPIVILAMSISLLIPLSLGGIEAFYSHQNIQHSVIILIILLALVTLFLNALRMYFFLRNNNTRPGLGKLCLYTLAVDFADKTTPGAVGGAVLMIALLKRHGIPIVISFSILTLIQLLDFITIGSFFLVSLYLALPPEVYTKLSLLLDRLFFIIAVTVVVTAIFFMLGKAANFIQPLTRMIASLRVRAQRHISAIKQGIKSGLTIRKPDVMVLIISTILLWFCQLTLLYLAIQAVGQAISWPQAAAAQLVAMIAGRLVMLPGGAGGSELSAIGTLSFWMDPAIAASAVLIWRASTLYFGIITGGIAAGYLWLNKSYH